MHKDAITILKRGGIGVLPTDTLYGVVGSALSKKAVARIYTVRNRNQKKPCIILIHSIRDLALFGISGRVSVIMPCPYKKFAYLHRGIKTLAFRMPADIRTRRLLQKTGPLVAPSANTEGMPPATTIAAAKRYFSESVDFYISAGKRVSAPSTLVVIEDGRIVIKRQGSTKVK